MIQRQKLGHKLYKVWTDLTGFDFPGDPDNLPVPSPPCPLHSSFREKRARFSYTDLEGLEHELQDALPLTLEALCPLLEH